MSSDHFHFHGPHDHAVEHATHGNDDFSSRIAVMTAILATAGALFSYQGGDTQNAALMYKNEAAIRKTEASDQWNFYQAKSSKQSMTERGATLTSGEKSAAYLRDVERYKSEKAEIKTKAERLEAESNTAEHHSEEAIHLHHRWAQAMTAIQVAISLAAITLLSRKTWMQYLAYTTAGIGCVLAGFAMLHM